MRAACCRFPSRKLACRKSSVRGTRRRWHDFRDGSTPRQQAASRKSGSKLHALQSFAPCAPIRFLSRSLLPVRPKHLFHPSPNLYAAHPGSSTLLLPTYRRSSRTAPSARPVTFYPSLPDVLTTHARLIVLLGGAQAGVPVSRRASGPAIAGPQSAGV